MKVCTDASYFDAKTIADPNGTLSVIEGSRHVPFEIKRLFYVYGVHPGDVRGQHAHREAAQALICVRGTVKVTVDDGRAKKTFTLDRPDRGLLIPPTLWAEQRYELAASVLLVLSDQPYSESDYIRDYAAFAEFRAPAPGGRK